MAWLFQNTEQNSDEGTHEFPWAVTEVEAEPMQLGEGGWGGSEGQPAGEEALAVIVQVAGKPEQWALMAPAGSEVRVNGVAVRGGIRVLQDHDLVVTTSGVALFSTERRAVVEAFAGVDGAIHCGRCKQELINGDDVVRCPGCATLFHEDGRRPCFTYRAAGCPFCAHPGTLDGQLRWTPGGF
jgi:hypothetical protein